MKTFNSLEEMQPYYNKKTYIYDFFENGERIDININFILKTTKSICAKNIKTKNIKAMNITASNIKASNIKACDITANNINAMDINANNINAKNIQANNINANNIIKSKIAFEILILDFFFFIDFYEKI